MSTNKEERALQEIEKIFTEAGKERLSFLQQCQTIQSLTRVLYQHEIKRRVKKRGEDDFFVNKFNEAERNKFAALKGMEVEKELTAITVPKADDSEVLIHGRITNENLRGMEGIVVSFEDAEGNPLRKLTGNTKKTGYFSLVIEPEILKKLPGEVYLIISTKTGEILHRESKPLMLTKGEEILFEIALGPNKLAGGDIREEKRKEANGNKEGETENDDLKRIEGIGKSRNEKLRKAGITDFKKFAATDDAKLKELLKNVSIQDVQQEQTD